MKAFKALALAGFMVCATAPAMAAPASIADQVEAFAKPSHAERLAVLKGLLDAHHLAYEVQPFESGKPGAPTTGYNVVVTIGSGDRDILLTAHYDAKVLKDGALVDGVVDNAASVVALIKAGDAIKDLKLKHRVRIILFDQEEFGLLGAKAYAAGPDAARVAGVINFDINAYGDTPFFAGAATPADEPLDAALAAACKVTAEDCRRFSDYPPSDHLAFRAKGVTATSISYLPKAEVEELHAFIQASKAGATGPGLPRVLAIIHTPGDVMAEVDPATIVKASRLAVETLKAFDAR